MHAAHAADTIGRLSRVSFFACGEDVAVVHHNVTDSTNLHVHEFFELVYVESGELIHRYGASAHRVKAGDLFIVNPNIPHAYDLTPSGAARIWNVLLTEDALGLLSVEPEMSALVQEIAGIERNLLECRCVSLDPDADAAVRGAIHHMAREFAEKRRGYRTVLKGHLLVILGILNRAIGVSGDRSHHSQGWRAVGEIIRYIVEHCDRPLTAAELASRAGWSPDHLSRLVKRVTGDTVQEYIGRVRAARAARLLLTHDWTVERIARQVGYGDARAFRRAFKRYFGATPAEFRAASQKGEAARAAPGAGTGAASQAAAGAMS